MEIIEVKERTPFLIKQLTDVWESSVKATHLFLSDNEIENIKQYVPQALESVAHLHIVLDKNTLPIAFIGIENQSLEMLFIKDEERGKGLGKQLLQFGVETYDVREVTVNEQNPQAKGFYEHMGFKVFKRSEFDEQGNPYPILYMELK